MERIGIYGGTFNPIHLGHLHLVNEIQAVLHFDQILFIPAKVPPHKEAPDLASGKDRLEMVRLAAEEIPGAMVSDIELHSHGKSYTVYTLEKLHALLPGKEFTLMMGADMLMTFDQWFRWQDILSMARIATVARGAGEVEALKKKAAELSTEGRVTVIEAAPLPMSSTEIREKIKAGGDLSAYLPEKVRRYIARTGLYGCKTDKGAFHGQKKAKIPAGEPWESYDKLLQEKLSKKRYHHSLAVMERAVFLAEKFGADVEKARLAGLLHDVMKDTENDSLLHFIENSGILITYADRAAPQLWHAIGGYVFLRDRLGYEDEDLLNAVRYHTTGRAGMSLLEKVIYLADLTSADRSYPDAEKTRKIVDRDLDQGMLYSMKFLICDLASHGKLLHPDTLACYNELVRNGVRVD